MSNLSMWPAIKTIAYHEILLAYRRGSELTKPLLFFVMVLILFPLAIGPEPSQLRLIAPAVLWIAALLANLVSLERLFHSDIVDGTLEQWLISPHNLPLLILAKVVAHWLVVNLPLLLVTPLLGILFHLSSHGIVILVASLVIGTPILNLIGAIGAALTLGLRNSAVLMTLIVLPLYVPVLIFGTTAVAAADSDLSAIGQLALLGALLILALCFAPLTTTASLRVGVSQ